jgi:predicted nucleic acid-binding protein
MNFAAIPAGVAVFLDANTLLNYFTAHAALGPPCRALLERVENRDIQGITSSHVLGEVTHRLMTVEACARFGWPNQGIALRLRNHPAEVQQLDRYRQALDEITLFGIQVLPVSGRDISLAADVCRQHGLLCNDAVIVALMQAQGLTHLASHDADFDRVPGITRYAPA